MVIDKLDRADQYFSLHPKFREAFKAISEGAVIYNELEGKKESDARLEAHRQNIDIQYVTHGIEKMGWRPLEACKEIDTPYNEEKDIVFFKEKPWTFFTVPAGYFVIFFPEDAHAPAIGDGMIRKVIIKVLK